MHQKFLRSQWIFVEDIALFIGTDMHSVYDHFALFNADKCFFDTAFSHAQRLYLCAVKFHTCLVFFLQKIIMVSLLVIRY